MFRDNIQGTRDFFSANIYPNPALQPEFTWLAKNYSHIPIEPPEINFIGTNRIYFTYVEMLESKGLIYQIAIYKLTANRWVLFKVLSTDGSATSGFELDKGSYIATLIDRFGREGVRRYFDV